MTDKSYKYRIAQSKGRLDASLRSYVKDTQEGDWRKFQWFVRWRLNIPITDDYAKELTAPYKREKLK